MAWAATGTPAWPQPDVKELFPLMLRQQKDPTWRSLAITMGTLNAGLVLGWAVGVVTSGTDSPVAVFGGAAGLIVLSICATMYWYWLLRSRYGLNFFLLGHEFQTKLPPVPQPVVPHLIEGTDPETGESIDQMLPGAVNAEHSEEELQTKIDRMGMHNAEDGPRVEDVTEAENKIRAVMEDGSPEDIGRIVNRYIHLLAEIQPDLLWAAELLQLRLSAASNAVVRARQQAEAMEEGRELGVSIPDYRAVRTSMKVAGGRPISPSQRKDGRDPLFETMELTMLELHRAPAASAKSEQEKKDLLAQLDLLRMAVEQLTVYRMMQKDDLHGVGRVMHFQDPAAAPAAATTTAAAAATLRQAVASVANDRSIRRITDAVDAARMCEALIHLVESTLNVSAYAARFPLTKRTDAAAADAAEAQLTYFATGASERGIHHQGLPADKCQLSYHAVGGRSTVDVTVAHQRTPKVHFWFGGTGKKGHLLLIPIATSATEPVLGVLAVDTLRKSQASHTSVHFDQEERDVLEYASAQMARALLRAREAQSEVQSQLLEAMHIEPEGKAGMQLQHMELLRIKSRLDAVLADGSPEMRSFVAEVRTMKEPPRDLVALGVAVLCLVRPEVTAEQLHKSFGSSSLPAAAEPCARFWRDWAHNALVEFGDSLMSALHAVDYRVRDGKAQRFEPLAALLDSVQPHPHKRFALVTFVFPWLRCVLALHTLVVPPSPSDAAATVMPAATTATTTRPASGAQPTARTTATNDHHDVL